MLLLGNVHRKNPRKGSDTMASVAVYQINRKCCATCRFWDGERRPEFRGNKLFQVKVIGSSSPCMAKSGSVSPVNYCPKWSKAPTLA